LLPVCFPLNAFGAKFSRSESITGKYPKQMKNFLVPKNLSGCRSIRGFPGIGNQVGQHLYDLACVPRMTGPEDGKSVLSRVLLGAAA
jgi:hypothetical protein